MPSQRRISFNESEAQELYEWRLALNQGAGKPHCVGCIAVSKKLESFIGRSAAHSLARMVKKNPYFPNLFNQKKDDEDDFV